MLLRPLLFAVADQCAFSGIMLSQNLRGMTLNEAIDAAKEKYIKDLSNYWSYYYALRQLTLFDFISGKDIDVNFERLIE